MQKPARMNTNRGIAMNGNGMFTVIALLPFIFYLVLIIFGVYFTIKVVKFMDTKIKLDQEKNEKIEHLIKAIKKENNN